MNYAGTEQTISVDGRRIRLSRFTRAMFREWLNWAAQQIPSPLATASDVLAMNLAEDLRTALLWELVRRTEDCGTMNDEAIQALWLSLQGRLYTLELLLNKYHFSEADVLAEKIADRYDVELLIQAASGKSPVDATQIVERYMIEKGLIPAPQAVAFNADGLPVVNNPDSVPADWAAIDRQIFQQLQITTAQVDELTLSEIANLLVEPSQVISTQMMREVMSRFPVDDQLSLALQIWT